MRCRETYTTRNRQLPATYWQWTETCAGGPLLQRRMDAASVEATENNQISDVNYCILNHIVTVHNVYGAVIVAVHCHCESSPGSSAKCSTQRQVATDLSTKPISLSQ